MLICATSIFRSIWLFFNSYLEYLRSFIYLFYYFFLVCVILVNFLKCLCLLVRDSNNVAV